GSYWGELLATAARYRGARGLVADAYTRDTLALIEMRFPTFAAGIHCADSLGRIDVDAVGVPIRCGGVEVRAGDLVLAHYDGVVDDLDDREPVVAHHPDARERGLRVLRDVRQRLRDDVERGRLDRARQPLLERRVELDRQRRPRGEALQSGVEPAVGQHGRV